LPVDDNGVIEGGNPVRKSKILRSLRSSREAREFDRAVRTASPSMQQELIAAAARSTYLPR
jgi:hypothetical protein